MIAHNRVLSPEEIRTCQDRPYGPSSIALGEYDMLIILRLFYENPSRQLRSYRDNLWQITGKLVSTDTIWRLIEFGFPYKGSLVKPNLVPLDKFKPANQVKSFKYIEILFYLYPFKVVFADGINTPYGTHCVICSGTKAM